MAVLLKKVLKKDQRNVSTGKSPISLSNKILFTWVPVFGGQTYNKS